MVAALATYVLLPAVLVLRDYVIWKLVSVYVLNDNLRSEIRRYAMLSDDYKKNCSGSHDFPLGKEKEGFAFVAKSQKVSDELNKTKFYIDRKSRFLSWMLKHYKQDGKNPIDEWLKQAHEEVANKNRGKS